MGEPERRAKRAEAAAALWERLGLDGAPGPHYERALTHPSFRNESKENVDNQRLEFLGDAVLGVCVSEMLMRAAAVDEGALTTMRAALVNAGALAEAARELQVGDALWLGRGAEAAGERQRANVLADAVEAILASVFLDRGLDAAKMVARKIVAGRYERVLATAGATLDPKSRLQERLQAQGLNPPTYAIVASSGPPHRRVFEAEVALEDPQTDTDEMRAYLGTGKSKKEAERAAAGEALEQLDAPLRDDAT